MTQRPIVLASASPRRMELLRQWTPEFEVDPAEVDETPLHDEDPWQTAIRLAQAKADVVFARHPEALVLAGDTVVALEGKPYEQLAKPSDRADAAQMLGALSDRKHLVITGLAVRSADRCQALAETTLVWFRALDPLEIDAYVATGEPMDKAGAYAIQGGAGGFVKKVEGSLSNVIGLPVERLPELMGGSLRA